MFREKKPKARLGSRLLRNLKRQATKFVWKRNGMTRKKPLKKQSRSQRNKLKIYFAVRDAFLAREENRLCEICRRRREAGENILQNEATECHHKFGRGKMLCEERGLISSCRYCRMWPHENPAKARALGLLN
jgi:hypothetical protein